MNQPTNLIPTEPDPTPKPDKGLHRQKKQRSSRQKGASVWRRHGLVLLLIACVIGGAILLLNPFALVMNNRFEENNNTMTNVLIWLAEAGGSQQLGGFLLLIALPVSIPLARRNLLHMTRLWRRNGCPRCGRDDLRRTSRIWRDRFLNRLGIPVRRYICADCHWQGARIDESHL